MIHPVILEGLEKFARHRRRLILARGICGTVAVWFAAMIFVAMLDRAVVLPDRLRLALSATGQLSAFVVFWFTCGRQLLRMPGHRELARLVELTEPKLHEELIAAVELGGQEGKHWDSEAFRATLQKTAAARVADLRVEALLTERLISRWLYAAMGVFAVFLVLALIPGLKFGQAFARAVAPTANIARPSAVEGTVLAPGDQIVPESDSIPVSVRVDGQVGQVTL